MDAIWTRLMSTFSNLSWKVRYFAITALLVFSIFEITNPMQSVSGEAPRAIAFWGGTGFALLLFFYFGAAQSSRQFLALFATSATAAAAGYLIAIFITATGREGENLSNIEKVVATALGGVMGTKLLSLWDDLTKVDPNSNGLPKIFSLQYYLPCIAALVGFTLSLATFYAIRSLDSGDVSVTAEPNRLISYQLTDEGEKHNGLLVPTDKTAEIQFSGAANSMTDLSVTWRVEPTNATAAVLEALGGDKSPLKFSSTPGHLVVPSTTDLKKVTITGGEFPLNWSVFATSVQDQTKSYEFKIRLCRADVAGDCPPVITKTPATTTSKGSDKK